MRERFGNQRAVTIHQWDSPKGKRYLSLKNALRRMNGKKSSGFIMWSVLRLDQDGWTRNMSDEYFFKEYGISADSYSTGWKILVESGFIITRNGNDYDFFEFPEAHLKEWETQFSEEVKNGETQVLKTGKPSFQKQENPSFENRETPPEIYNNNIMINNEYLPPNPQRGNSRENPLIFYQQGMNQAILDGKAEKEIAVWFILAEIQKEYPYFTKSRGGDPAVIHSLWNEVLDTQVSREDMKEAFLKYQRSDKSQYPPASIGVLLKYLQGGRFSYFGRDDDKEEEEKPEKRRALVESSCGALVEIDVSFIPKEYTVELNGDVIDKSGVHNSEFENRIKEKLT